MKIYTRNGDQGKTDSSLGARILKDDPFVEACGTVDELNAMLGMVRAESIPKDINALLERVQHELFGLGADLAMLCVLGDEAARIGSEHVSQLEREIDEFDAELPALKEFILPGGCRAAATIHVARTVCRRAERRVVAYGGTSQDRDAMVPAIRYLNRLSDLLFVLSRVANTRLAVDDERWRQGQSIDPT